jgi:hypothetical protein
MTLRGECVNASHTVCIECGAELSIKVCASAVGYYIGFFCPNCGPYSRESGYFGNREEAESALSSGLFGR